MLYIHKPVFLKSFYTLFFARPKKRVKRNDAPRKVSFRVSFLFFGKCRTHVPSARSNMLHFFSEKHLLTRDFSKGYPTLKKKKSRMCICIFARMYQRLLKGNHSLLGNIIHINNKCKQNITNMLHYFSGMTSL